MSRYIYEAEFEKNELGGYSVIFPQLPDAFTHGKDLFEAVDRAAEVLGLELCSRLDEGVALPKPVFRGFSDDVFRVAVAVELTPELMERIKCVTATEAAKMLGLSKSRISHMLDSGVLQAVPFGNDRLVTLASVNERIAAPRSAGRPRKDAVAV